MVFNSVSFLYFFPAFIFLYIFSPKRFRPYILLGSSYYFYGSWNYKFLSLILLSTIVDYFCAIKIENSKQQYSRKIFLYISITLNLGLLFAFKYYNFFIDSLVTLLNLQSSSLFLEVILPVGISFYTFQTMSYSIEVYLRRQKPETDFINFANYVSYFPQLVAGPIERPQNLLHQIKNDISFKYKNIQEGGRLFLYGLFKKIVVADNISGYVDAVFNNLDKHSSFSLILAGVFFSIQIYCDFSGYSDMAIGLSKSMNINLMKNFETPYFSKNITEFWKRWHISLSSWFRDYVYINLGGSRVSQFLTYRNLVITFLVSGLWHGANWTFILWGLYHGILVALDKVTPKIPLPKLLKIFLTFGLACYGFIIFRCESLSQFVEFNKILISSYNLEVFGVEKIIEYSFFLLPFIVIELIINNKDFAFVCDKINSIFLRKLFYGVLIIMIINLGVFHGKSFIYFQF